MTGAFTYGSVCSGIEAATMAWHPLGWSPSFFAEIEAFPSAVLAHHYGSNMPGQRPARNGVPNLGDFTKIGADTGPVDLLVGGTPCQSFSVAGKRLGLDDPRGNLALEYLALADRLRARWIVWENVPGVLSSRSGGEADDEDDEGTGGGASDFATFLSYVSECGFGYAYRVLDAQYVRSGGYGRAVPQRRRRVFLVGHRGDFRPAAAVLFDPEGLRGDSPPRRETGQSVAGTIDAGLGVRGQPEAERGHLITAERDISGRVSSKWAKGAGGPAGDEAQNLIAFSAKDYGADAAIGVAPTVRSGHHDASHANAGVMPAIAHALRAEGFDASEDGSGRGTPLVAFDTTQITSRANGSNPQPGDPCHPITAKGHAPAVAFQERGRSGERNIEIGGDVAYALTAPKEGGRAQERNILSPQWEVRRLTPRECERLQGFPDDFTLIPWRGRDADDFTLIPWRGRDADDCPDGPRYRALGNSMAVNVMRWIGERIDIFEREVRPVLEGRAA